MVNGPAKEGSFDSPTIPNKGYWQVILSRCPEPDLESIVNYLRDLDTRPEEVQEISSMLNSKEEQEKFKNLISKLSKIGTREF